MADLVQSFERGLAVIRSFGADAPEQTLADVARSTGLARATVRRLLQTLEELGYARRRGSLFMLTPRVLDLGYAYLSSSTVAELAVPYLERLSATVNESCSVAVLDDADVVYIARVPAKRVMTVSIGLGSRFEAYRTSLGRAQLAWLDDDTVAQVWAQSRREDPTARTVTDLSGLRERLAEVRQLGYALVDQELEEGVRSVAAPIRNGRDEVVAAVNVSTHTSRTSKSELRASVVPALLRAAADISAALGTVPAGAR